MNRPWPWTLAIAASCLHLQRTNVAVVAKFKRVEQLNQPRSHKHYFTSARPQSRQENPINDLLAEVHTGPRDASGQTRVSWAEAVYQLARATFNLGYLETPLL